MSVGNIGRLSRRVAMLESKLRRKAADEVEVDAVNDLEARMAELEDLDFEDEFGIDDVELAEDEVEGEEDMFDLETLASDDDAEDDADDAEEDDTDVEAAEDIDLDGFDDEVEASEVDPDGVEEQISQDSLSEVLGVTKGTQSKTHDSMLSVGKKAYVAKMREASARLDRVASYLEKTGRVKLACRIDRIADAVDAKIKQVR